MVDFIYFMRITMKKTFNEKINSLIVQRDSIDVEGLKNNRELCLNQLNSLFLDEMLDSSDDRVKTILSEIGGINDQIKIAKKLDANIEHYKSKCEEIKNLPIYSKTNEWIYELFRWDPVYDYAIQNGRHDVIEKMRARSLSLEEYEKLYLEFNYPNLFQLISTDSLQGESNNQENQKSNEEILDSLWINYEKLGWEILPSVPNRKIIKWSWVWFNNQRNVGKLKKIFNEILIEEKWISKEDFVVKAWIIVGNKIRNLSYIAIIIPKLNKTILINDCSHEATFVYDGILWDNDLLNIWKTTMDERYHKFNYTDSRNERLGKCIFPKDIKSEISEYSVGENDINNQEDIKNKQEDIKKILLSEEWKTKWFALKTVIDRRCFRLPNWQTFNKIARIFGFDYDKWPKRDDICKTEEVYNELTKLIYWLDCFVESEEDIRKNLYSPEMIYTWFHLLEVKQRSSFTLSTGTSYSKIAEVFGFDNNWRELYSYRTHKELWKKIYWKDYKYFEERYSVEKEYRRFIGENFIKWFKITNRYNTLLNFETDGKEYWFMKMQTILLWDDRIKGRYNEKNHINISKKLFLDWELSDLLERQKDLIINELRNNKKFKKKRFKIGSKTIYKIGFEWELNYISLARILLFDQWIKGNWEFDIYWESAYNQLTQIIFWWLN